MYTLRSFDSEGIESNFYLGKNYQLIKRHVNKEAFQRAYKEVFGKEHVADLDETATTCTKECAGFLMDENGVLIYLNKTMIYYIMSSDGKTFANISDRTNRGQTI